MKFPYIIFFYLLRYIYKHKKCKDIIDRIDYELAKVYGLSDTELAYIKSFALKYRMSDGTKG